MNYHKLREWLSEQEHIQWEYWSKSLAKDLQIIIDLSCKGKLQAIQHKINSILIRWKKNWKPYSKLDKDTKDYDREWADKILDNVPIKCPVYQCGGLMITKERKLPKDFVESEHYDGDDQTPDLVCTNCKAIYQFKGFKNNEKRKKTKNN